MRVELDPRYIYIYISTYTHRYINIDIHLHKSYKLLAHILAFQMMLILSVANESFCNMFNSKLQPKSSNIYK